MDQNQNTFNVSQDFEIIPHQKSKAYPIGVNEWEFIKTKVKTIKVDINHFHTVGFLLLGAAASCLITILATKFTEENMSSKYLCWAVFAVSAISGLLCIFFAKDKHKQEVAKPTEIVNQMELIESRFLK